VNAPIRLLLLLLFAASSACVAGTPPPRASVPRLVREPMVGDDGVGRGVAATATQQERMRESERRAPVASPVNAAR